VSGSTKQRRARARRRQARRIVVQEAVLVSEGEPPEILTLVEGPLAVVLEITDEDGTSIYLGGPGAPWGNRREGQC
jgi:hypothetical protein